MIWLKKKNAFRWDWKILSRLLTIIIIITNNSLKFAVMTGCMRISKESIFTGLNNLKVLSITDERYDEYFGFTDMEVKNMLEYYGTEEHYEEAKSWYDGYQFGSVEVYCPWDVLNYCDKLKDHADSFPENYWINISGNDAVKKFIQMSGNFKTKREIETLLAGEEIIKEATMSPLELESGLSNA